MLHTQLIEATGGCNGIRDDGLLDSATSSVNDTLASMDIVKSASNIYQKVWLRQNWRTESFVTESTYHYRRLIVFP